MSWLGDAVRLLAVVVLDPRFQGAAGALFAVLLDLLYNDGGVQRAVLGAAAAKCVSL